MARAILVIEDNEELAKLLDLHLRDLDCRIDLTYDGDTGLSKALNGTYDLIILDLMLPGTDGLDICRRVRMEKVYTPILMLTARSTELDRVLGLELGADDYVTKPFSIRELQARVKAIFRRVKELSQQGSSDRAGVLRAGRLSIDPEKRRVTMARKPLDLTPREFDLLLHFARHPGRVFTRPQLLDTVWGYGHDGYEHTVNSHINRLRAKIETDPTRPEFILTVWGVGYKFSDNLDTRQ